MSEFIGKEFLHLPQCHSTNDFVIDLCKNTYINNGFLCITDHQTAGKGQRGNAWLTQPNKNLTFSFVLEIENYSLENIFKTNILISMGIIKYLNEKITTKESDFKIKWPNDFYFKNKKIGGMLIEIIKNIQDKQTLIIGIGLNINQTDFSYLNAISLKNIFKNEYDLQIELQKIMLSIESFLKLNHLSNEELIQNLYTQNLYLFQIVARYKIENEVIESMIVDVNNEGKLGLKMKNKIQYFEKKEVVFI